MPERTPTVGRSRRPIRRLAAGAVLVALAVGTGCGDGSTAGTGAPSNPTATPGGKGPQKAPVNKRMPE